MSNLLLLILCVLLSFGALLTAFHFGKVFVYAFLGAYIGFALPSMFLMIDLFGFPLAFMEIAYATWFLTTDIFSEHYGKREAQKLITVTALLLGFFFILSQIILRIIPHVDDFSLLPLVALFQPLTRIMIMIIIIFLLEQLLDIFLFEKIRKKTKGKRLWLRNCGSTLTTQAIDVLVLYPLAFYGTFPNLWKLMVTAYCFKAIVAFLDTPFVYLSYRVRPRELRDNGNQPS